MPKQKVANDRTAPLSDAHSLEKRLLNHGPLWIALAATVAVLVTIAPDGLGPGVTCDELYHVLQGKQLVTALRNQGLAFFLPSNIDRNFAWPPDGPPVQAPLGYWILGGTHYCFDPQPDNPTIISITAARFAPAVAFGVLIAMVGVWTARRVGRMAGLVGAAAVALTPRLFGHAHLASLDMLTTVFFIGAILVVLEAERGSHAWHFAVAGIAWGAAILVRLHGLLLAPPVVLWIVWRFRRHAVRPLAAWLGTGGLTVLAGWPWLWLAPIARFHQYLSSGAGRQALHVFYFGQAWGDRDVPWHYPWVMFCAVLPLGFLALGLYGLGIGLRKDRRTDITARKSHAPGYFHSILLLAGTLIFVLMVFSWPGTPVYDGVRLFLMAFPIWAVFVGIGVQHLAGDWGLHRLRSMAILSFVAMQGIGLIVYFPCHLSHYGLLVGGLPGAVRLGFEATYWGDTVREPLLAEAARLSPERPVALAPNLAPFQAPAITITSPSLATAHTELIDWDLAKSSGDCRYAIVYHRRADSTEVDSILNAGRVVMEYENQGVWLARLVQRNAPLDGAGLERVELTDSP